MSKGLPHGSREFKESLVEGGKLQTARRVIDGDAGREGKEQIWGSALDTCFGKLREGGRPEAARILETLKSSFMS